MYIHKYNVVLYHFVSLGSSGWSGGAKLLGHGYILKSTAETYRHF